MLFDGIMVLQGPLTRLLLRIGRAELAQVLMSAGYLLISALLAWTGLQYRSSGLQLAAVLVALAGAAIAWHLSNRRWHLIHDTPTTRVRSAAQGFVELVGLAELSQGQAPLAFNGLPPCVWFEVVITARSKETGRSSTWTRISDETFVLRDETGECVIDPDHAEVHMARVRRWSIAERSYHARYLMQGDVLYAIGALETLRGDDGGLDRRADMAALLRLWKGNSASLHRRFDTDRDGDISPEEWQQAVAEAERIVKAQHKDLREHPDVNILRAPKRDLPYILSNRDPDALARRFRHWSYVHASVFILALGGGARLATG